MREYIAAEDIANQISMLRSVFHGPVMIVEGVTDKRLYGKFIDSEETEIIVAHSKDNVRLAVREMHLRRKDDRVLGIMDSDMDRMSGKIPKTPLFLTDERDSEMMMIRSTALDDVVWEYGEENKVENFVEKQGEVRDVLLNASYPLGLLMFVSQRNDFGLSFKDLDFSRFIDPVTLSVNVRNMVDEVLYASRDPSVSAKRIRNALEEEMEVERDPWIVCRGHDAVAVLLVAFKKIFGSYNSRSMRCGELGGALRLSFKLEDFMTTRLYADTSRWCDDRSIRIWVTD